MLKNHRQFIFYLIRFLGIFGILYGGTLLVIALSAPGGYYSEFVARHLDYVSGMKQMIMSNVGMVAGWFGYDTIKEPNFLVRIVGKRGVIIAMDCVGYGVYSFWIAYVISNSGALLRKLGWVVGGLFLLWSINIARVTMFLISINKNQTMPFGLDHHTWFNIIAYIAIFGMMWIYERHGSVKHNQNAERNY